MIIQCEQCQTKFKLDDSKVTDKPVKVRCSKCKHVFAVTKEQPSEEPFDFSSSFEDAPASAEEEGAFSAPPIEQFESQEQPTEFSFNTDFPEEAADNTVSMESEPFETMALDSNFAPSGNDEFTLSSLEGDREFAAEQDEAPPTQGEVDFDSFDFGESEAEEDNDTEAPPSPDFGDETMIRPPMSAEPAIKETVQGLDFSDDNMFGAAIVPPDEEPTALTSFDFGTDSFADSMEMGGVEAGEGSSLSLDSGADAHFSLGEIDFGDEFTSVAVQQVNPDALKPGQEILFAPLAEAQEKPQPPADAFKQESGQGHDDLPPLSIASRRKQSPLFTGLIVVVVLLVVVAAGYFGITSSPGDKGNVTQEAGKISVRAVKASYVKNASAGSLLVISGEAVNEYPEPRGALQVKGVIFDANGQILASKSAFGGNLFTDEQLASLPLDKIEAAMSNQFGDSLTNLEVATGKAVSFMIVIATPSVEGKNFGVEPVGSTIAKAKPQQ